ncbi:unnamed protein product [Paramecium sonneborni]|uniref:Uncharacterized protein n=1 Tax=Paramecium sonneborni TaxID=65129 RepID=A0A8S1N678_9CILI|nr:unnamed protein product [Paramecium sonneborni]
MKGSIKQNRQMLQFERKFVMFSIIFYKLYPTDLKLQRRQMLIKQIRFGSYLNSI